MHLSLLLFLQRGPPRFNWVLMESKSPLSLQPELDRLIPPQSAPGFTGCMENSHSAQSGRETRWWVRLVGARRYPLSLDNSRRGTPGEKLSPGSALHAVGKALESHRLSVHPASSLGLLSPVGHICILTGKYSRFWIHMGMKHVNKWNRKRIKEVFKRFFLASMEKKGNNELWW